MMSGLSSVVKQHPLITFFLLTFALSWTFEIPLVVLGDSIAGTQALVLIILASNVPSVLGIVLTAIVLGGGVLRKLLGRLLVWRVDPRWYLVVLGPVALAGGMVALNALVGGPDMSLGVPLFGVLTLLAFSIFPGSALGEEIGWRGYALPRLQAGRSALSASFILGAIWGSWHLPLYFTGQAERPLGLFPLFVVAVIALSVILAWVYNGTGGPPDGGPAARHVQPPPDAPHRAPREPGHGALLDLRRAVGGGSDRGGRLGRAEAPFPQAQEAGGGGSCGAPGSCASRGHQAHPRVNREAYRRTLGG